MDHYERSKLADAIKEERYAKDDFIIKEVSHSISRAAILIVYREIVAIYSI